MASTILVTGSTGTVGREVVKQLSAAGASVRAAVQATSNVEKIRGAGVEPFVTDLGDSESIQSALDGVERAFLLTPPAPNTVELAARFIEAAKKSGLKRIVRLSVLGAYAEPGIALTRSHRQTERDIEASGIAYTFLRPNFFMQNFLGQATIKSQGAFYDSSQDGKASHVDVRDVARVAVAALTESGHEGKAYDLTGPQALSNYEVADILSSVAGRKIRYVPIPDDDAREAMRGAGVPDQYVEELIELFANKRAGRAAAVSLAIEEVTGRKPTSFEQFARDYVEAFK